jgi:hypothetical protein
VDVDALLTKETKEAVMSPTATASMIMDGFRWLTIPLRFVAWQDVSHLTVMK